MWHNIKNTKNVGRYRVAPEVANQIIEKCVNTLNEANNLNYSSKFWNILLHKYVKGCASFVHSIDKNTLSIHKFKPTLTAPPAFNYYKNIEKMQKRSKIDYYKFKIGSFGNILDNKPLLNKDQKKITIGNRKNELSNLGFGKPYKDRAILLTKNKESREKIISATDKFDIRDKVIIQSIPEVYVEYLKHYLKVMPDLDYSNLVINGTLHTSLEEMIFLAHAIDNGAKFCYFQDGWEHETVRHGAKVDRILSIAHSYNTFGWEGLSKTKPYGAVRSLQFEKKYLPETNRKYDICIPLVTVQNYNEEVAHYSKLFFNSIDRTKYQNILVRPRSISRKFSLLNKSINKKSHNIPSDVDISDGLGSAASDVSKAKCVVNWFSPSTIFLECLFVSHPVFILLPNEKITDIFIPIYDKLVELKIAHSDISSLCEHLNKIDVVLWWEQISKSDDFIMIKEKLAKRPGELRKDNK